MRIIDNSNCKPPSGKRTVIGGKTKEETAYKENENELTMPTSCFRRKPISNAVPTAQSAYLEIFGVEENPFGYELSTQEIDIGRRPDCEVHLPLSGVSRLHARIYYQNEEYYVEDLDSTNGTYVNTVKVVKCILRNNDQIEIGDVKIIFVEEKTRQLLQ